MNRITTHLTVLATVIATVLSPAATVAAIVGRADRRIRARLDDETGASDIVVVALISGIAAIIVVAYMAIVRNKVTDEANNLPSSS